MGNLMEQDLLEGVLMDKVTLEEYQDFVETTWLKESSSTREELRIFYGIIGELGEIAELNKKFMRDGLPDGIDDWRKNIKKEFGDVFYYLAKYANYFDIDLNEVLALNVIKLSSRKDRGVIGGSGNDR